MARALLYGNVEVITMAQNPQTQQQNQSSDRGNQGKPGFENEGEGNKTAARNYNKATEEYVQSGKSEHAAQVAKEALDSEEGDALREAEEATRATVPETPEQTQK
jgi:hypothetical protein